MSSSSHQPGHRFSSTRNRSALDRNSLNSGNIVGIDAAGSLSGHNTSGRLSGDQHSLRGGSLPQGQHSVHQSHHGQHGSAIGSTNSGSKRSGFRPLILPPPPRLPGTTLGSKQKGYYGLGGTASQASASAGMAQQPSGTQQTASQQPGGTQQPSSGVSQQQLGVSQQSQQRQRGSGNATTSQQPGGSGIFQGGRGSGNFSDFLAGRSLPEQSSSSSSNVPVGSAGDAHTTMTSNNNFSNAKNAATAHTTMTSNNNFSNAKNAATVTPSKLDLLPGTILSLRQQIQTSFQMHSYSIGIFYANLVYSLTNLDLDFYSLLECLFQNGEYTRIIHLLQNEREDLLQLQLPQNGEISDSMNGNANSMLIISSSSSESLVTTPAVIPDNRFLLLYIQSLYRIKRYDEVLENTKMLESWNPSFGSAFNASNNPVSAFNPTSSPSLSLLCMYRGYVYEESGNIDNAVENYQKALRLNAYNYDAISKLFGTKILSQKEQDSLIERMSGNVADCDQWLLSLWNCKSFKSDGVQKVKEYRKIVYGETCKEGNDDVDDDVEMGNAKKEVFPPVYEVKGSSRRGDSQEQKLEKVNPVQKRLHARNVLTMLKNRGNSYVSTLLAEKQFNLGNFQEAYNTSKKVLEKDPFCLDGNLMLIHIGSLVMLGSHTLVFYIASQLLKSYPAKALSWYAAGCYYYMVKESQKARKFFYKATCLDSTMAEAWIAYGHSFALCDESDPALAAYRTASFTHKNAFYPHLFTGMEYIKTRNFVLAHQCLQTAATVLGAEYGDFDLVSKDKKNRLTHSENRLTHSENDSENRLTPVPPKEYEDPYLLNELGVVHYELKRYEKSITFFQRAAELLPNESCFVENLGHSYLKAHMVKHALDAFEKAERILNGSDSNRFSEDLGGDLLIESGLEKEVLGSSPTPGISSSSSNEALVNIKNGIGFCKFQLEDIDASIECYHRALALDADNGFAQEALAIAIQESATIGNIPELLIGEHDSGMMDTRNERTICTDQKLFQNEDVFTPDGPSSGRGGMGMMCTDTPE